MPSSASRLAGTPASFVSWRRRSARSSGRSTAPPAWTTVFVRDRFFVILPETGPEGARAFAHRLETAAKDVLRRPGCDVDEFVSATALTSPDEPGSLTQLCREIAQLDAERRQAAGA